MNANRFGVREGSWRHEAAGAGTDMAVGDDIRFHSERAQAERDRASGAASASAARAHLALAELHLERARILRDMAQAPLSAVLT